MVRIHPLQQIKNMKYLITSGCSFTSAHRVNLERAEDNFLVDDIRNWYYPHWLQHKFPELKVFNMGNPANNNSMIVRSAIYKAKELLNSGVDGKDISMIIQWSSFSVEHILSQMKLKNIYH